MPVQIPPQPGNRVWLVESETNPLPQGWIENQQVTVIRQNGGNFVVKALDGEFEIELTSSNLDGGWIFALPGGYCCSEAGRGAAATARYSSCGSVSGDLVACVEEEWG
jgi:hypothetical protein